MNIYLVTYMADTKNPIFNFSMLPRQVHKLIEAESEWHARSHLKQDSYVRRIVSCEYMGTKDEIEVAA